MVYVDNYAIGTTPVSTNYTYYGSHTIRLVKGGYQTKVIEQPVLTPWYEIPGIDFISENLVPGEIRDYRTFDYVLEAERVVPTEELRANGEALRQQTHQLTSASTVASPQALPGQAGPGAPSVPSLDTITPPGGFGPSASPSLSPSALPGTPAMLPGPPGTSGTTPAAGPGFSGSAPDSFSADAVAPPSAAGANALPGAGSAEPPAGWRSGGNNALPSQPSNGP
jgi:hypothetical protein